jgi:cyclohexa-1,5-dienecarbonyl-CoA hydratase
VQSTSQPSAMTITRIQPSFDKIKLVVDAPVAQIVLENPPVNVIDLAMIDELVAAMEHVEERADVSVLVFSGAGVDFSVGVDIEAHTPDLVTGMLGKFHSVIRAIVQTAKVTIAAVQGNCLGGGAELALVCDMAFCTEGARFQFPEIQLACFPPVAAVALAPVVGQKRAAEMILTGNIVHGDEAFHIGLANDAVADESELHEVVQDVVQRLAGLSPAALRVAKKALYSWDAVHFDKGLQRSETIYKQELMATEDAREGIAAWIEKRGPVWKGR